MLAPLTSIKGYLSALVAYLLTDILNSHGGAICTVSHSYFYYLATTCETWLEKIK